jgi:Domain of unknown function (DUF4340)
LQIPEGIKKMSTNENKKTASGDDMSRKTWLYVGGAAACLAVTGLFEVAGRPEAIKEYGKVGQAFYPAFEDPTQATSLTVAVIDPQEVKPLEFSVKQAESGRWVIPSHNYQADAADRLAQTASSIIGITRGAMVTRWPADHAKYGVVDPERETVEVDELEGIGKRLTLRGKDDAVLASYIIGKEVEGQTGQYYVRHPEEDETYIADLKINLSTKFSDWVNTDLLEISDFDARRLDLFDYSFEERGPQLAVTNTVVSTLTRGTSSEDWTLAGLDDDTKELDQTKVKDTVKAIAELKLSGVRPKQPGLTADLKLDRTAIKTQRDVDRLQTDLLSRGFLLQPSESDPDSLRLISREGELSIGTEDGLSYLLHFGRVFTGSSEELEIGFGEAGEDKPAQPKQQEDAKAEATAEKAEEPGQEETAEEKAADENATAEKDSEAKAEEKTEDGENKETKETESPGRYVFVRVTFDKTLLGEELTKPVEPTMPEELKENPQPKEEGEQEPAEDKPAEDQPATEEATAGDDKDEAGETAEGESKEESPEDKLAKIRAEYEAAKQKYQDDVKAFDAYQEKIKAAEKKAADLNRRFAQWYYVIPGDSFDKLTLSRNDLLKDKEAKDAAAEDPAAGPSSLDGLGINLDPAQMPATKPAGEQATPAEGSPAAETKPADEPAPADEAKPAEPTPAVEAKPAEESPAAEPAPADEAAPGDAPEPAADSGSTAE